MYVSKLFDIAKLAGLSQQDIIKHLGLNSHVPTVLWAGGKRPMPHKYLEPLRELLECKCAEKAAALPAQEAQAFNAEIERLLNEWVLEVRESRDTGPSTALYGEIQHLIALYEGMDLRTFKAQLAKTVHRQQLYDSIVALKQDFETFDLVFPVENAKAEEFVAEFKAPKLRAAFVGLDPADPIDPRNTNAL
jgi:hypothetical protein